LSAAKVFRGVAKVLGILQRP
jgi:hypothetical protein